MRHILQLDNFLIPNDTVKYMHYFDLICTVSFVLNDILTCTFMLYRSWVTALIAKATFIKGFIVINAVLEKFNEHNC